MFNGGNRPNNALSTWVEPLGTQLLCATRRDKRHKKDTTKKKKTTTSLTAVQGIYLLTARFPLLPSAFVQLNTPHWPPYTNTKHQSCIATSSAIQL